MQVNKYDGLEELTDLMQNVKTASWEKFLENSGGVYGIKLYMDMEEGNNVNKVTPTTGEHLIIKQEGDKDNVGEYPIPKEERQRGRRAPLNRQFHVENFKRKIPVKEGNPRNPERKERKVQYKPTKDETIPLHDGGMEDIIPENEINGFRSSDMLQGEKRIFRSGLGGGGIPRKKRMQQKTWTLIP